MSEMPKMRGLERAIALRGVEAFAEVPMEQLAFLAEVARESWHDAGTTLFDQGDPPGALYVLLEGRVSLFRDEAHFGDATAGEALGTWSLFEDHPRRATARVEEPVRVLELPRDAFYDVLADHAEITRSLVQHLVRRLTQLAGLE